MESDPQLEMLFYWLFYGRTGPIIKHLPWAGYLNSKCSSTPHSSWSGWAQQTGTGSPFAFFGALQGVFAAI
jgi:hypothetical protein